MEQPYIVQAEYSFRGENNDELCFKKGDIITVTQREEGGWWEGTLGEITGWFPSNYVKEYKAPLPVSETLRPPEEIQEYRSVVLRDLLESEKAHVAEIQGLLENFLEPLQTSQILSGDEYAQLMCNFVEVVRTHEELLRGLENCNDRVGKLFMTKAPTMKIVHQAYCAAHPRAIVILDKYKDELEAFMERQGAATPGLLVLTTGLSKPFRRLDKYSAMLQELERHMESSHADRGDTQRSVSVYKDIAATCSATRRQKELELQVLTGPVRGWQGQELSTLGDIIHMGSVAVGPDHRDRYFVLFPQTLLILSVSQRMSAFIYEGKLPLTGIIVNRLEDSEGFKNAFEISGPLIEKIVAVCQGPNEASKWVELLGSTTPSVPVNIKRNVSTSAIGAPQPPAHSSPYFLDTRGYCARFSLYAYNLENPNFRFTLPPQNYPPAAPYTSLSAHFHSLYREGKISRNIMKALLYPELIKYVDTSGIVFRRRYKAMVRIRKKIEKINKNESGKLARQKAVELSSSDSGDSEIGSCDTNPFGYVKFYTGKHSIEEPEVFETFIDHEEPPKEMRRDCETKRHRSSLEISSFHPEAGKLERKDPVQTENIVPDGKINHTSTARLNLGELKQQLSESSHISSFDGRVPGNYMACEDLANLNDETKIKANDTKPTILPDDRHSMPTLFVGNRFNSSSLTEVYVPTWKDRAEPLKQSIPDEDERASWSDHNTKVSCNEIGDDSYEYNDDSITTHSSSIDLPAVMPAPDKISAELLYNFDDTIIKPPSPFDCYDESKPMEFSRGNTPFRQHSLNSDKNLITRESKSSMTDEEKKERKNSVRRCISYQYVRMGKTDKNPNESDRANTKKTQCKCCKSSQCISQRSSDSGMAGSCTLASPDPPNLSDEFNYPFEMYIDSSRLSGGRGLRHSRSSQDLTQFNMYGMFQNKYTDSISDRYSNQQNSIHGINLRRGSSRGHSAERTVLTNTKIIYLGMQPPNSSESNLISGSDENFGMFKTGMYAHWWKKEKLPNSILRGIIRSHKDVPAKSDERKDESSSLSSLGDRGSDVTPSLSRNEPPPTRYPPNTSTVTTQTEPVVQPSSQLQSISCPSSTTSSATSTSSKSVSTKPQIKFSPNVEHYESSKSSSTGAKRKNRKHKS